MLSRILLVSVLAASVSTLAAAEKIYTDISGTSFSHPLINGQVVTASPPVVWNPLSNRALLAARLPPRSPKFVESLVAKRRPSAVELAPRGTSSQTPITGTANIIVKDENGATLGFVGKQLTDFDTFPITQDSTLALTVTVVPSTDPSSDFIDLKIPGQPADTGFVGLALGAAGDAFGKGNAAYGFMGPISESTTPDSDPNNVGGASQSQIWTLNPSTLVLSAFWRGESGDPIPLTLFADGTFGDLDFAGDLTAFVNKFGDFVQKVTFVLRPN
ncbi:hypothetical protein SISSUDRAFT_1050324 [Sistotremastrum suecicum HHB10207 ss-3]|uniref:Uncharacterized protein n=1 Tax=Sistotremastrum suecicum HHB10207 ss-3 TaxID=1314776 RepID=A0A166B996_9AGAM|nr:hypothetical protein SISSUDRAFT_1050324 [Sistotremastrum suecicum HHB10207 ss-3]